jgi:DNA-binding NarL/FixJ family response regulator
VITVCIADDHDLIREGLRKILSRAPDIHVVGEAVNGLEVLDVVRQTRANVLVLDISMPGASGLDLLPEIRRESMDTAILIVSMHPEERFAARAMRAGASGYLTKDKAGLHLVEAVRRLAAGGRFLTSDIAV